MDIKINKDTIQDVTNLMLEKYPSFLFNDLLELTILKGIEKLEEEYNEEG